MCTHKDDLEDQPKTLPVHAISKKVTKENEREFLQNSPLGKKVEHCRPSLGRRHISDLINHQVWSRATRPLLALMSDSLPPKTPVLQVAEMSKEDSPSYSTKNPHLASVAPRYAIVLTSIVSLILGVALASFSMLYKPPHHTSAHRVGRLPSKLISCFASK
jgi:hypothetical protein